MRFEAPDHNVEGLIEYELLAPDVYTPPRTHNRLDEDRYAAPFDPHLELLDELDIIRVTDWGEGS